MDETLDDILFGKPDAIVGEVLLDGDLQLVVSPMDVQKYDLLRVPNTGETLLVTAVRTVSAGQKLLEVTRGFGNSKRAHANGDKIIVVGKSFVEK